MFLIGVHETRYGINHQKLRYLVDGYHTYNNNLNSSIGRFGRLSFGSIMKRALNHNSNTLVRKCRIYLNKTVKIFKVNYVVRCRLGHVWEINNIGMIDNFKAVQNDVLRFISYGRHTHKTSAYEYISTLTKYR